MAEIFGFNKLKKCECGRVWFVAQPQGRGGAAGSGCLSGEFDTHLSSII